MMLVPEPWEQLPEMAPDRRAFYDFHAGMMEQWDGPAALAFSDGVLAGATLDRNGSARFATPSRTTDSSSLDRKPERSPLTRRGSSRRVGLGPVR